MDSQKWIDNVLLPSLDRPSRYLGTELNRVVKDPATTKARIVLAFPDLYDLALGNLGLQILYNIVNAHPDFAAERAYAPAADMELALRKAEQPLFALESREPLHVFDGVGFTLQSELTSTNILNILDLGGIPLRAVNRQDRHPLVFMGGPCAFNPEPLAPFMDFVVLGDGEQVVLEVLASLARTRGLPRRARILEIATLEGVYVPALREMETLPSGMRVPMREPPVRRRFVADLDAASFPTRLLVPFTPLVHDRLGLEVLRGCTRGCRFCQAGMISRPVRERSPDTLTRLLADGLAATGYEEASLVSLSTCDHSHIRQLISQMEAISRPRRASISLPSLRLDGFSVDLAASITGVRRTSLTFAPESASPRLRALINKWIPDDDLVALTNQAYQRGWDHLKLYFMIGIPTETDEDVQAIAQLAIRVLQEGRRVNRRAELNLGVSSFVPKPHTPLQWAEQASPEEIRRRQHILYEALRRYPAIKFGRHDPDESWLEGILGRGDRRVAEVVEAVFHRGGRFDAWREHRRMDLWREAIDEAGLDPASYLAARDVAERLPWDHVDTRVDRTWLADEWERAKKGQLTPDCRPGGCQGCGLMDADPSACLVALRLTAPVDAPPLPTPTERLEEALPIQRLVVRTARRDSLRLLSNRETMTAWIRALRRSDLPLAYSRGFHSMPRLAFSTAFPQGEETEGDYVDIDFTESCEPHRVLALLRANLPQGIHALAITQVPLQARSLMAQVAGSRYRVHIDGAPSELSERVASFMAAKQVLFERTGGDGLRTVDLRPGVLGMDLPDACTLDFTTLAVQGPQARPRDLLEALGLDTGLCRVVKQDCIRATTAGFDDFSLAFQWEI